MWQGNAELGFSSIKVASYDCASFPLLKELTRKFDEIVVDVKQGQGLFFNQYLVHRGGVNTTDRTRFGLITLYHSMSNSKFTPYKILLSSSRCVI